MLAITQQYIFMLQPHAKRKIYIISESGRWTQQLSKEQQVIRCCITDGTTEEFSGRCVIVYRLKSNLEFGIKQLLDVS